MNTGTTPESMCFGQSRGTRGVKHGTTSPTWPERTAAKKPALTRYFISFSNKTQPIIFLLHDFHFEY